MNESESLFQILLQLFGSSTEDFLQALRSLLDLIDNV